MPNLRTALVGLVVSLVLCPSAGAGPVADPSGDPRPLPTWGSLQPGPLAVGFEITTLDDPSRQERGQPRRLRLVTWYPAHSASGQTRTMELLVETLNKYGHNRGWNRQALAQLSVGELSGLTAEEEAALRSDQETAVEAELYEIYGAAPLVKKSDRRGRNRGEELEAADLGSPLLVWGLRHGTTLAQSVMSSYLASHGYVVIAAEPLDIRPEYPWQEDDPVAIHRSIRTWTDDVKAVLAHGRQRSDVDSHKTALLAWSYGGISALLTAIEAPGIDAFVSLDSTAFWTVERLAETPYGDASAATMPGLIFASVRERTETVAESWGGPLRFWTTAAARHGNFNAAQGVWPTALKLGPPARWSSDDGEGTLHAAIAGVTRSFLDETLRSIAPDARQVERFAATLGAEIVERPATAPVDAESLLRAALAGEADWPSEQQCVEVGVETYLSFAGRLRDEIRFPDAVDVLLEARRCFPDSEEIRTALEDAEVRVWL